MAADVKRKSASGRASPAAVDTASQGYSAATCARSMIPIQLYTKSFNRASDQQTIMRSTNGHTAAVEATSAAYNTKIKTKVVVRLLPPTMTEEELLGSIGEKFSPKITDLFFVQGRRSKILSKPSRNSFCLLNFETTQIAEDFIKSYHGHTLVDEKHEVFRAVAVMAPYQKVARKKAHPDRKENTIEEAAAYKAFCEALQEPGTSSGVTLKARPITHSYHEVVDDEGIVVTPLLLAVRKKHGIITKVNGVVYDMKPPKHQEETLHEPHESGYRTVSADVSVSKAGSGGTKKGYPEKVILTKKNKSAKDDASNHSRKAVGSKKKGDGVAEKRRERESAKRDDDISVTDSKAKHVKGSGRVMYVPLKKKEGDELDDDPSGLSVKAGRIRSASASSSSSKRLSEKERPERAIWRQCLKALGPTTTTAPSTCSTASTNLPAPSLSYSATNASTSSSAVKKQRNSVEQTDKLYAEIGKKVTPRKNSVISDGTATADNRTFAWKPKTRNG